MSTTLSTTRAQARWMKPNASLWVRPDAARFYAPGMNLADVFPVLALKYSPNQPRVPSGNPDGGRWTDGEGGAGRLTQPMGRIGITDRRVVSDADPEGVKPGARYTQARGGRGRGGGPSSDMTTAQAARLEVVRARAEDAAARVREIDPQWRPKPSAYQTPDGMIRAYEADAAQAYARMRELADRRFLTGPFGGESIEARGSGRLNATEQAEINRIGRETGCHSCGVRDLGTTSSNFVGDPLPPSALIEPHVSQRLFPQCLTCSRIQGGNVRHFKARRVE